MIKDFLKYHSITKCFFAIMVLLTSITLFSCDNANGSDSNIKNINTNEEVSNDSIYNETALLFAGKELPQSSNLYKFSQTKYYKSYSRQIEKNWDNLQRLNEKRISAWREKYLSGTYTPTIFYPFSGPDILNAIIFFPAGNEYIMFGLEAPGDVPHPHNLTNDQLRSGLKKLWEALDTVINVNFFKTIEMQHEISTNSFDSITSVMMFFLARTNYNVVSAGKVWIDDKGAVVNVKPKGKFRVAVPGSEIVFKKNNSDIIKKVYYYQIDISDVSLKKHSNFASYLKSKGNFTTIIKSASYLMHRDKQFRAIRDLILSKSDFLLQDDSGIPLRYFSSNDWKLSFHGTYKKPIQLFASRYQDDFFQTMKKSSTGPLDFSYGYNFKDHDHNLMFGERIKE